MSAVQGVLSLAVAVELGPSRLCSASLCFDAGRSKNPVELEQRQKANGLSVPSLSHHGSFFFFFWLCFCFKVILARNNCELGNNQRNHVSFKD